ncbi:MAG: Holliday junction resolvase RuvX [Pseudomonadota bacterium]
MSVHEVFEEFAAATPLKGRLIGLDLGSKTIGVALSDSLQTVASPNALIKRQKFKADAASLLTTCVEFDVVGIVLGLPNNMDGSAGPRVQSTRAFARNLSGYTDIPMSFWDERLSTAAVTRTLIEADRSRARRSELVDKMAAAYILQGALDRLKGLRADVSG